MFGSVNSLVLCGGGVAGGGGGAVEDQLTLNALGIRKARVAAEFFTH